MNPTFADYDCPKSYVEILETRLSHLTASIVAQQADLEAILHPSNSSEDIVFQPEIENVGSSESSAAIHGSSTPTRQSQDDIANTQHSDSLLTTESVMSLSRMGESSSNGLWTYHTVLSMLLQSDGSDPFCTSRSEELLFDMSSMAAIGTFSSMLGQVMLASGSRLLELYIANIHSLYPFLSLSKLRETLSYCIRTKSLRGAQQGDDEDIHAFELLSLLSVLAIGLIFDSKRNQAQASLLSNQLIFSAIGQLESVLSKGTALQEIQALLLFTTYSLYTSGLGSSWQLIGLAMRQCVSRSYHNPAEDSPKSSTGRKPEQGVRATFWSCYMLERSISWALDRPTVLENADIFIQVSDSLRARVLLSNNCFQTSCLQRPQMTKTLCFVT